MYNLIMNSKYTFDNLQNGSNSKIDKANAVQFYLETRKQIIQVLYLLNNKIEDRELTDIEKKINQILGDIE